MRSVISRFIAPLTRVLFRPSLLGLEKLPTVPFVLVANHSGGLGIAEALCLAALFLRDTSGHTPLAPMVLPTNYFLPGNAQLMTALGAIPSTRAAALAALRGGIALLVFPGGDHEALRPIWQANRVDFGGRTGFVRLAREACVPVVPLGIRGGHWTAPSLLRSRFLAYLFVVPRLLGAKRWGISLRRRAARPRARRGGACTTRPCVIVSDVEGASADAVVEDDALCP